MSDELPKVEQGDAGDMLPVKRGYRFPISLESILRDIRPGRYVESPHSKWWLLKRKIFGWLWTVAVGKMEERGRRVGFLRNEHCYECGGYPVVTDELVEGRWIFDG